MKSKDKIFSALSGIILIVIMIAFSPPAAADDTSFPLQAACATDALDCNFFRSPYDGQMILILTPANFNGTLIMYAHGYVPPPLPDEEEILELPFDELEGFIEPLTFLLSKGFAFATTSYSKNGYAVEQAGADLRDLAIYFKQLISPVETEKILLIGASEGASVIQMLIEKYPEEFDGGLAMCGPVAGMPYQINKVGDFFVIFDYLFPKVFDGRLSLSNPDFGEEGYGYVQTHWEDYEDNIARAIKTHPLKTLMLFGITDTAFNWFDKESFVDAAHLQLGRTVFGTEDIIKTADVWAKDNYGDEIEVTGVPFDNDHRWYDASWRLNSRIGVERVTGDSYAMEYVKTFYQPTGKLHKPLVTMHNWNDPNVSFEHEVLYAHLVKKNSCKRNLTVLPIPGFGHCNFEPDQVLKAFSLLLMQIDYDL